MSMGMKLCAFMTGVEKTFNIHEYKISRDALLCWLFPVVGCGLWKESGCVLIVVWELDFVGRRRYMRLQDRMGRG